MLVEGMLYLDVKAELNGFVVRYVEDLALAKNQFSMKYIFYHGK